MDKSSRSTQALRNRFGHAVEVPVFTATEAKNAFGVLMDAAAEHGTVAVTKRDVPEAVLLSMEEYEALVARIPDPLASLTQEFDELVERMQSPRSKRAVAALFDATPKELGRAAVKGARRSRRG